MSLKLSLAALTALASIQQVTARPVTDNEVTNTTAVDNVHQFEATPVQPSCQTDTILVGDGDPHQNYYEIQVTVPIDCGGGTGGCSSTKINSHTVSWTAGATVNIGPWISGGFSVSESTTTGDSRTCIGSPGETICVWASIPHTAYTVYNKVGGVYCGDEYETDSYIIRSPNEGTDGLRYYCVQNEACRSDGDGYWNYDGRAGGP